MKAAYFYLIMKQGKFSLQRKKAMSNVETNVVLAKTEAVCNTAEAQSWCYWKLSLLVSKLS